MYAQRRKKKRSNNRIYRVELERGSNGEFGFSIFSDENHCSISCVAKTSPVYGLLKAGDFLIAVKDLESDGPEINVSKMSHDQIVEIISNAPGRLRLAIAERHYFSSDEECDYMGKYQQSHSTKPVKIYHDRRPNPLMRTPLFPYSLEGHHRSRHFHDLGARASCSKENIDYSAILAAQSQSCTYGSQEFFIDDPLTVANQRKTLEFKIVVGYLGTIEMPKQIATSSKHTTVKGCIRKLRQEKRTPSIVLMTILPTSLTLTNSENVVLANYPAIRLNYVSSSSESNSKYFGLVTSATYANGMMCDTVEVIPPSNEISVSNSCHVFVVDKNITEHEMHVTAAAQFKIECTRDQVTGYCLEFPTNSEYIVSLIRSMYTRREEKTVVHPSSSMNVRNLNLQFRPRRTQPLRNRVRQDNQERGNASPQMSNNSETTTSSSNSDSGIGFHNDCTNISDRIVVVDFPHRSDIFSVTSRTNNIHNHSSRPIGIIHEVPNHENPPELSLTANNPIYETVYPRKFPSVFEERAIDVPEHILDYARDTIASMKNKINVTQSCDDLSMPSSDSNNLKSDQYRAMQMSADNIVDIAISSCHQQGEFLMPQKPLKKIKKSRTLPNNNKQSKPDQTTKKGEQSEKLISYKLSPKVFGLPRPISMSFENLSSGLWGSGHKKALNFDYMSNSVQDLTEDRGGFKDGTISEPDLTAHHENQAYHEDKSPFHRKNQASFRSLSNFGLRNNDHHLDKLSSSESSICKQSTESIDKCALRGPSAWSSSLEKLLEDKEGIHVFAEFLKKEISAENIYFWAACERYRHMSDADRATEARQIFDKYLGPNASDPVNVDSKARTTTQERLSLAEVDLFDSARKQIFNLMKFDSYSRFLKSDMYKMCLESENKKQKRNNFPIDQFDPLLNISSPNKLNPVSKIKKSYSNAEDRRRSTLLPWNRKNRSQSKDRLKDPTLPKKIELKDQNKQLAASKGSVNEMQAFDNACNYDAMISKTSDDRHSNLCRIVLPDGANSISQVRDEPIRNYVNKILEKRGIMYRNFEVFYFDKKSSQPLDLSSSALSLAHQQIKVEQRVLFKLDLPNKKVISVKSKANKMLSEVLKPILNKYNYKMEEVQGFIRENGQNALDTSLPVTAVEDKRLLILYKNCDDAKQLLKPDKSNTLDEITNKVFNEVLQGKIDSESVQTSTQSEDFYSEASSSRHKNFLSHLPILNSMRPIPKEECDTEVDGSREEGKKPLIAKLKAGVKLQTPETKAQELLAEIKRAQRARLEDQRGTEITIPVPEFLLKDKENVNKKPEPAPRLSLSEGQNPNVFSKVQSFESGMSTSPSKHDYHHKISPNHRIPKNYDEGEIAYIDSNIGDTTLVFHHDIPGSSNTTTTTEPTLYKKFQNSPPPLPPKPKARQSNENSPDKSTTHFTHSFPSGTFI